MHTLRTIGTAYGSNNDAYCIAEWYGIGKE